MKKKIFFAICMALMLFSVFAVVTSAAEITYSADFGTITSIDDMPVIDGIDTSARVVLKNSDGTYTTYPTYYIMKNSKTFGTDYTNLNAKNTLGQTYTDASMILIEIPDGVTGISSKLFGMDSTSHPTTSLEKIVILSNDYTKIEQQTFRRMPTVKSVTISASITMIDSWAFCGSPALQEVIFAEGSLLETTGNSFSGCTALSSINLEACTKLKTLGGEAFNGCTSLRKIALPDSIETIGGKAFYKIGVFELASDYLPKNLKTISSHFLSGCNVKNEVLYFPQGFTDFSGTYHFNDGFSPVTEMTLVFLGKMTNVNIPNANLTSFTGSGTKKPLKIVFAQNTFDELNGVFLQGVEHNGAFGYIYSKGDGSTPYYVKENGTLTVTLCNDNPNSEDNLGTNENGDKLFKTENAPANIIFCGGETVEQCYSVRTNDTDKGWYRFFTTEREYDLEAHKSSGVHYNNRVIHLGNCGYDETSENTCVVCDEQSVTVLTPATGLHIYTDDFNCESALICEVCEKTIKEALTHDLITVINYENGYAQVGTKVVSCKNEGCTVCNENVEAESLFINQGYSTKEYADGGFSISFVVNRSAISQYTEITGNSIKYGVFAVAGAKIGTSEAVNADGTTANGVARVDFTNKGYDLVAIRIVGFTTDEHKNAQLALGAYVIENENKVSYLQVGTPETGAKYSFVTFNGLV